MAGILGCIPVNSVTNSCTSDQFSKMLTGIVYQDSQPTAKIKIENAWLGIAGRVNEKKVQVHSIADKVYCVSEGDIHILPEVYMEILKSNPELSNETTASLIPFLFIKYGDSLPEKLTGNYNICCYHSENRQVLLFNGRFGMLPLFYYIDDRYLIFASKLLAIINSGLVQINWDHLTQLEQIIFNYPITDHSLIKNIKTLPVGNMINLYSSSFELEEYWSIKQLFGRKPLSKKESFETVYNSFEQSITRALNLFGEGHSKIGLSLTGGWDGRLGLSYLLKNGFSDKLLLYSFGAEGSNDVTIPAAISNKLKITYKQIILNDNYVDNHFINNANDTIMLSNGNRNFLRTHYLFTMKKLSTSTGIIISGNCGSNILKFGLFKPGTVFNQNLFSLIMSNDLNAWVETMIMNYSKIIPGIDESMKDAFMERVNPLINLFKNAETNMQGYYSVLLNTVERNFFGAEQNSYNDFVFNYSPFIDYQFIDTLSRTLYWGANYSFNSNSLILRKQSTDLYNQIIKRNNLVLWNATTDREISFKDLSTFAGKIKILKRKFFTKRSINDTFHTHLLQDIFSNHFHLQANNGLNKEAAANYLSTELFRKKIAD